MKGLANEANLAAPCSFSIIMIVSLNGACGRPSHRLLDSVESLAAVLKPRQTLNVPPDALQSRLQPLYLCQQGIVGLTVHTTAGGSQ